jgi:hypothetical protein
MELRPLASPSPAAAIASLPPGGGSLAGRSLDGAELRIGRFSDPPAVPLAVPPMAKRALLAIPRDGNPIPWRLAAHAGQPVSLCPLKPPGQPRPGATASVRAGLIGSEGQ